MYQYAATDRFRSYRGSEPRPNFTERARWRAWFKARPELKDYWWHAEEEHAAENRPKHDLGDGYSTDGQRIYMRDISLDDVDPATFRNLGNSFCCDKNGMYSFDCYATGRMLDGGKPANGDPATFEDLGFGYFKDKNNGCRRHPRDAVVAFKGKADATIEVMVAR